MAVMTEMETRIKEQYQLWSNDDYFDRETRNELLAIRDQEEINDRFYMELEFGTAGLRGLLGAGTNRMNRYTVRKTAKALGEYICGMGADAVQRGVAIAYDSRHFSSEFARETALVLAQLGVKALLFESLRPTPVLSFAVRYYGCMAGVNVTASHNPKEYNGYKVYWEDGSQISPTRAQQIVVQMHAQESHVVVLADWEEGKKKGLIKEIGQECDSAYLKEIYERMPNSAMCEEHGNELSIIYTPLHGAGLALCKRALLEKGFSNVRVVEAQADPDGEFPTVKNPNPEAPEAFALALSQAEKVQADILLATDPDADRIGIYVDHEDRYVKLNGNQIGSLLLYYLIHAKRVGSRLPEKGIVIKSVATGDMAAAVAQHYGLELRITPVGFRYIGEQILQMEKENGDEFLFGFEESYGFLAGDYVRDKDAVQACLLLSEAALHYKLEGKTLVDVLAEMSSIVGYFADEQLSYTLQGITGRQRIDAIMMALREAQFIDLGEFQVESIEDFETGYRLELESGKRIEIEDIKGKMLKWNLKGGGFVLARPSGTEPKIKFYFSLKGDSEKNLSEHLYKVKKDFLSPIKQQLEATCS